MKNMDRINLFRKTDSTLVYIASKALVLEIGLSTVF